MVYSLKLSLYIQIQCMIKLKLLITRFTSVLPININTNFITAVLLICNRKQLYTNRIVSSLET